MDCKNAVGLVGSVAGVSATFRLAMDTSEPLLSAIALAVAGALVLVGAALVARALDADMRDDDGSAGAAADDRPC
jgi:hypothetical protein